MVFRITPKRLNTVNVLRPTSKLILPVIHPKMLCKSHINQTMITAPSVSIDDALNGDMAAYNLLQRGFGGIGYDFRIDLISPFEYLKDDGFTTSTASAFATNTLRTKVGFVKFNNTIKRSLLLTFSS